MRFQDWLKKQGEFVDSREVVKFLESRGRKGGRGKCWAVIVRREIRLSLQGREWMWIPTKVWEHEYYNF